MPLLDASWFSTTFLYFNAKEQGVVCYAYPDLQYVPPVSAGCVLDATMSLDEILR